MTTQNDGAFGFKKESTFGVYAVPDHFTEIISEDFSVELDFSDGKGMRYGKRMQRADRRTLIRTSTKGSVTVEALTKGIGALFEAALGTSSSTIIAGSAYQQLFTPTTTDPLPTYTIQNSVPFVGGGAAQPQSYLGQVCTGFEITGDNGGVPTIKFDFIGKSLDTGQTLAAPSYPSGAALFSFTGSSIKIGGSVTVPTTTALSSGGTVAADVLDVKLSYDNGTDKGGFFIGGGGAMGRPPVVGTRKITGSVTAEYDTNVLRDAYLNQTDLALVLKFATTTLISGSSYPTLEITVPNIRLEGEVPNVNGGDVTTQKIDFTGLDNGVAAQPIYVALVTPETAV